jgi:hypothetical protein
VKSACINCGKKFVDFQKPIKNESFGKKVDFNWVIHRLSGVEN